MGNVLYFRKDKYNQILVVTMQLVAFACLSCTWIVAKDKLTTWGGDIIGLWTRVEYC